MNKLNVKYLGALLLCLTDTRTIPARVILTDKRPFFSKTIDAADLAHSY